MLPVTYLLDALYPPRCLGCETYGTWLCEHCLAETATPGFEEDRGWIGNYRHPTLRRIIGQLKYHSATCLTDSLQALLEASRPELEPWIEGTQPDWIVPAPCDARRVRERGIDHALLAAHVARRALFPDAEVVQALERTKTVLANAHLPHEARASNLKGAIACHQGLSGTVLLIDDVYTTGATAGACMEALANAGASDVRIFTLARS